MSAFIVSDFHINVLVSWAAGRHGSDAVSYYWNGDRHYVRSNPKGVAAELYAENVRSVNARYNEDSMETGFKYEALPMGYLNISAVQILKACNCYEYQACETDNWVKSEAHAIIEGIRDAAIHALPGYDDADWEINIPTRNVRASLVDIEPAGSC